MGGKGAQYLKRSFDMMCIQTFKDFDIVVSDQSKNTAIEDVCREYGDRLDIHYFKEDPRATPSDNTNNALKRATGKLIKILFLDDYLYHSESLQHIVDNFDLAKDAWLITACIHTKDGANYFREFHPRFNGEKILEKNTVSAPSVVTIKNSPSIPLFDTNLIWWQDLDFYRALFNLYGNPKILGSVDIAIRVHENQMGNSSPTKRRETEYAYVLKKHKIRHKHALLLLYKAKRMKSFIKSCIVSIIGYTK